MCVKQIFELSMVLNGNKFWKIFSQSYIENDYLSENEDDYVDRTLAPKGMVVMYRNSQYKKRVTLIVDVAVVTNGDITNTDRLIRKLEKRIDKYFDSCYQLDEFTLSGLTFSTDIDVGSRKNVSAYLKVLQRIGKVKGFSPSDYDCFDDGTSFCLDGNSNGVQFLIYDLERTLASRLENSNTNQKKLQSMTENSQGILRIEIRLAKPKAIRVYTDATDVSDILTQIVTIGNFYKKDRECAETHSCSLSST